MTRRPSASVMLALFILFSSTPTLADTSFWVDTYLGIGPELAAVGADINYGNRSTVYTLGYSENSDCLVLCSEEERFGETYLMIGRKKAGKWFNGTMQAGLNSNTRGDTGTTYLGIPIDFRFTLGKYVGFNIGVHTNLNSYRSVVMLKLGYTLGSFN